MLHAVTRAYCEQLCCYSHCGLFEEGMHMHTRANTPTAQRAHTRTHTGHAGKLMQG